ncbi:MAG: plasma-membrane proton-efflux P-type ATPase [Simkaniaceae bacterium]|nr:plasma-membrane proton-efflux P-type ATPase [Simkaniaceae bacterium]
MAEGLTSQEAEERLKKYGENILELKKKRIWLRLFTFFWGPIPCMIEIAAILSGYLERWPDFIMIVALLLINAALGFVQEYKANSAIEALKSKLALKARALRDGKWQAIEARFLVPGDVILVKLGNIIPADIKLTSGEYLSVDQSALTGESLAVDKKVGDTAYSGTTAKLGEMMGEVTATGLNTFFGKTAKLVATAKTKSHFQKAVLKIGHFLILLTLGIAAILLTRALIRVEAAQTFYVDIGNLVVFLLVLIIAGIPVALPAVLSMTLAIGANRMAKLKAIVSKLISIEELAGMDILCSDKTGTLTKNELTVGKVMAIDKPVDQVLHAAALACHLHGDDPIDKAILSQIKNSDDLKQYKVEKMVPFDPVIKRTEMTRKTPEGKTFMVTKGAPQIVLELAKPDETLRKKVHDAIDQFAARGFRTLGVAEGNGSSWKFLGLISLFDPPRDDTKETVDAARAMHVTVKMITGDNTAIAKETASKLDLGSTIMTPKDITKENIETADGFAEVFPEHKCKIVQTFQQKKHIVGMTGDGVNDAPALKQADVGIAVSSASDAARAAADLILTQPGLLVIKKAIDEARCIFGRMKSYALYRISETCRLLFFLFLAMALFDIQPLTAVMIILIALLNDIPIMMIAYDHMKVEPKPVSWNMHEIFTVASGLAMVGVVSTSILFWIGQNVWLLGPGKTKTLAFMAILCGGNLTIYLTRNRGHLLEKPLPEWKFFLATLFSQVIGTLVSVYGLGTSDFVGIGWALVGWSWLYIAAWFPVCIGVKLFLYKLFKFETHHRTKSFKESDSR